MSVPMTNPDYSESSANTAVLVPVTVPGVVNPIMVCGDADNGYVAINPICNVLGLDMSSQVRKLRSKVWATPVMMTVVGADGKARGMSMIHRNAVPSIPWESRLAPSGAGADCSR